FTATQIPYIAGRTYPPQLAGPLYPDGIPIVDETALETVIARHAVHEAYFAYSDIAYAALMSLASRAQAAGADFILPDPRRLMLKASKPVISICAVRTGAGKSQTTRHVAALLRERGLRTAVVRHPMPYGDLNAQRVQRFATVDDLTRANCTIEEREEYEPHLSRGTLVFAGVDYALILAAAEREADVLLWDGGNNDLPFFAPDLHVVVADPHRAGHERAFYPGEVNARLADVFVINKEDSADAAQVSALVQSLGALSPEAPVVHCDSLITVDDAAALKGKRVLCVEDGPTLTHGGMTFGAAVIAARQFGATPVDPRPYVTGSIAETFLQYPDIGPLLPAVGYSEAQMRDLAETIRRVVADVVLIGTPIGLTRLVTFDKPAQRVRYDLKEKGEPSLTTLVGRFLDARGRS
ncbi:MAG: GTPase, partial [Deltaproteobacteria bacterium]|nr:GTPase [Deltaproteobacteria bacterium]